MNDSNSYRIGALRLKKLDLGLHLFLPYKRRIRSMFFSSKNSHGPTTERFITFTTGVMLFTGSTYWQFDVQLFGFGFSLAYQRNDR